MSSIGTRLIHLDMSSLCIRSFGIRFASTFNKKQSSYEDAMQSRKTSSYADANLLRETVSDADSSRKTVSYVHTNSPNKNVSYSDTNISSKTASYGDIDISSKTLSLEDVTKERTLEISTCGQLFEKWRREKRYWSVPKSDVSFAVKYIDTGHAGLSSSGPIVVSLHGSPGSYRDFEPVTSYLYRQGVRVIAPNFPGGSDVHPKIFRHTPEEKSEYIRDFLRALRVPRVDLVLCHSSALFPGLQLSLENKGIAVNSLGLLNPTGLEIPRLLNPVWLTYPLARLVEFPLGYKLTCLFGERLAKKPELKGGSFQEHLLSAITLLNSNIPKQNIPFQSLLEQNFPVLLAFSNNDKLIAKKTSMQMAKMMVDEKDICTYNREGEMDHSGGVNPFRKVMVFQNGSHFLLRTYPETICKAVSTFLFQQFNNRVNSK